MNSETKTRLAALNFKHEIKRLTEDFIGREWIFNEIDKWLQRENERFFILTGEPGVGKSAIAARLTQVRADKIAAYHFCIAGNVGTITPNSALRSLAAQLGDSLPDYGQALANTIKPHQVSVNVNQHVDKVDAGAKVVGVIINHITASNPDEELDILFRAPLAALEPPAEHVIILIDSLDEAATYASQINLITLLAKANDLPSWVRFVCTTRPAQKILSHFKRFKPYTLAAESQMNLDDLNRYIDYRMARGGMQAQLQAANVETQALENQIKNLADGNFLYTKVLLNDIETGQQPLDDLSALPKSLDEIYHGFLRRFFDDDWEQHYQPLLGKLAVAQEWLTEDKLADFARLRPRQVRRSLGILAQYLDTAKDDQSNKIYRLFHQSMRDYLLDKQRGGLFWCDPEEEHELIAAYLTEHYQGKWHNCDGYGLRHLPTHLAGARQDQQLSELLTNFNWLQAKLNATDVASLGEDCDLLANDPSLRRLHDALWLSAHTLNQDKTQLAGQLHGRLLSYQDPALQSMLEQARQQQKMSWLRPLTPSLNSPDEPLRFTLTKHAYTVRSIAVTPDGKRAVSAGASGKLIIWDLLRKSALHDWKGHQDQIYAIALTSDGKRIISASNDTTIVVWDLENRTKLLTLTGHEGSVRAVAVTPDDRRIISSSTDGTVKLWDLASGQLLHTLPGHPGYHHALVVTPDGKKAIIAHENQLAVWTISQEIDSAPKMAQTLQLLEGHSGEVAGLAVTPDGQRIISASYDKTLKVWDLESGMLLHTLYGHERGVNGVAITPDGRWAVSASEDFTLIQWDITPRIDNDLESARQVLRFVDHTDNVKAVAVTPDGQRAISASSDETLKIWDLKGKTEMTTSPRHKFMPAMEIVMPDGNRALSISDDHTIVMWDLEHRKKLFTLTGHTGPVKQIVVTPDGQRAISASEDQTLRVWDLKSQVAHFALTRRAEEVYALAVAPDGQHAASISSDGAVRVWNLDTKAELYTFTDQIPPVIQLVITHKGRRVIFVSLDGIRVWDWESGVRALSEPRPVGGFVFSTQRAAYVTPDGGRAIYAIDNHQLKVVDMERLAETHTLNCEYPHPQVVAITLDGRCAIAISHNGNFNLWDLKHDRRFSFPTDHDRVVTGVAISLNGRYAATVAGFGNIKMSRAPDRTLKVWDIATEFGPTHGSRRLVASYVGDKVLKECTIVEDNVTFVAGPHTLRLEGVD
ncbi:AAA family ATPase [Chloroflexota bacterium]